MDRNRRIVFTILILILVSCILAVIDISMNMQKVKPGAFQLSLPESDPGVGVVKLYGAITIADDGRSVFGIESGADGVIKRLTELENDSRIKAIIIRINSPGGTVAATQEIFEKLMKLRKNNMPLVASMGDVAASGGYYIASACNYIFANHGTVTGSIGVIAVSPNLKGLFEKLGIKMNVIKSGKYKDILASHRDLSDEEKELLQQMIDSSYEKFLKDVSFGRNIPIEDIKSHADGRVMNGETALKYKLIDSIGTYEDAIDKARMLAKLPENSPVYDDIVSPFEQLIMSIKSMLGNSVNQVNQIEQNLKLKRYSIIEYRIEQ